MSSKKTGSKHLKKLMLLTGENNMLLVALNTSGCETRNIMYMNRLEFEASPPISIRPLGQASQQPIARKLHSPYRPLAHVQYVPQSSPQVHPPLEPCADCLLPIERSRIIHRSSARRWQAPLHIERAAFQRLVSPELSGSHAASQRSCRQRTGRWTCFAGACRERTCR